MNGSTLRRIVLTTSVTAALLGGTAIVVPATLVLVSAAVSTDAHAAVTPMSGYNGSQYIPLIEQKAAQYGVPAQILYNQMITESGGNVLGKDGKVLTSGAGAKGLMQFMPGTAGQYGVDVSNASSSIDGAARYMRDLGKMFNGDWTKAVMSYNWGQGNVQKWVAAGSDPSKVPAETAGYVNKVIGGNLIGTGEFGAGLRGGYINATLEGVDTTTVSAEGILEGCEETEPLLRAARQNAIERDIATKVAMMQDPPKVEEMSCLSSILGGFGASIGLPDLSTIWGNLRSSACAWVNSMTAQAWNRAIGPVSNMGLSSAGAYIPGTGIGTGSIGVTGGINNQSNGLTVNGRPIN